jgi:hypothetical protein
MRKRLTFIAATLALTAVAAVACAQRQGTNTAPASGRYLPEYTKESDLVLPKSWRSWVYVGSPLTPDGLTEGKEGFSEYHNVYIELGSSTLVTLASITGAFSWWRNIPGTGAAI